MHWIVKAAAIGAATGWGAMKARAELEKRGYSPEVQAAALGAATLVIFIASTAIAGAAVDAAENAAGLA